MKFRTRPIFFDSIRWNLKERPQRKAVEINHLKEDVRMTEKYPASPIE